MVATQSKIVVPKLVEDDNPVITVGRWFKQVGDVVAADEPLVELETDKLTMEIPSPFDGTLQTIVADQGTKVDIGAVLATLISDADVTVTNATATASSEASASAGDSASVVEEFVEEFTPEEWDEIKRQTLEQIIAATLDSPEHHLGYIRERIGKGSSKHA